MAITILRRRGWRSPRAIDDLRVEEIDLGKGSTGAAFRRREEMAAYEARTRAELDSAVMPTSSVVRHAWQAPAADDDSNL